VNVIRARILGFCSGVRRAVDLAYAEDRKPVYTLGPLIHNPQVLEELKRRGVEILDEEHLPADLRGASVIIRAHGISPQTEAELRRRGIARVIDATCPRVKSSQLKAEAFAQAGYCLFLAGEERHAEITGIRGYYEAGSLNNAARFCAVVSCAAEAEKAAAQLRENSPNAKTALIGQTTISTAEYRDIAEAITPFFPGLEIAQTICAATEERQDSLREITDKVDAVIIAGGKASANTRRLLAIAEAAGKPCALAETPADIPPAFLKFNSIGLASGTSTPDTVIDDIEKAIT
jgi:4-hydroxy-3-methylbut-2-enyl diphosphate reductase